MPRTHSHPNPNPHPRRPRHTLALSLALGSLTLSLPAATATAAAPTPPAATTPAAPTPTPASHPLPTISPTPQHLTRTGPDIVVPDRVDLIVGKDTDAAARTLLTETLRAHGVRHVDVRDRPAAHARLSILLGPAARTDIARALTGTAVPQHAEGYALRVGRRTVALGGTDATGQYYAVQTLRQLLIPATAPRAQAGPHAQADPSARTSPRSRPAANPRTATATPRLSSVSVSDHPSMPLRGSIEGFYGPPWTRAERLDHMDFLGQVKSNTYVYAPKDDPYHREKWREPYPAETFAELGELVERATANHVRFTFAVSPGASICYSDPADTKALTAKLQAMYDLGVRTVSVPLDDISYTKWNCDADLAAFGAPGQAAAARAQVSLLNTLQKDFVATRPGMRPLQMVPTEYGDLKDSPYKQVLRDTLDKPVEVMWTGTDVVPPAITVDQAKKASELFGRKVFVWDNYPVNDFGRTAGRLLLAPYDKREPGLSDHLTGLISNPMNQEAASKPAVFTMSDFAWNDRGYDRTRSARQAALHLAGGDARLADAVQRFVDLNHLAPTFGTTPWQPQSPVFGPKTTAFWERYASDPRGAIRAFRPAVREIADLPDTLRRGLPDKLFLSDASNWLDATKLWGQSMAYGLDALTAIGRGDAAAAETARRAMDARAGAAVKITVDPKEHHQLGRVRLGDPFIEDFVTKVRAVHDAAKGE
ncbi:beta-N-acetylglucosaminidase domain-containing protein [Streptomyces sp. NPDC004111]|uniref:beta-N-acetylhexosaminidase family protein n=1 Tax=Streptomyces sp. NPDC004111 TaxID=3364690 RepID=UPI00367EFB4A